MHIEIPLTQGRIALIDKIDSDLAEFKWYTLHRNYNLDYAARTVNASNNKKRQCLLMHRVILERIIGNPLKQTEQVDHINGNGLDNRRDNLRFSHQLENTWNTRIRIDNTSRYKGVHWHKRANKWCAAIRANGKYIYLGLYDTPELAHEAYKAAALKYHGEFARF